MNKPVYVYDIETYPNVFIFVFRPVQKERKIVIFEISSRRDNRKELLSFLQNDQVQVGYNNLFFDYPVIHYLIKNPNATLKQLYNEVQQIINSDQARVPFWKVQIEQIDLLKIWHYDNANRMTSLKWLEFSLRWHKVQDLPFRPGTIIPEKDFDKLIEYCINDVDFTYFFLGKSIEPINFRYQMTTDLSHNVMNYSDVKIGEYINQITYCKNSGREFRDFKDQKTHREIFYAKDLIPAWVTFSTDNLTSFLDNLRDLQFSLDVGFEFNPIIGDLVVNFMMGGLHSQDSARIFKCKEGWRLKESDVGSMYPKSIIEGNLYPEHLGPSWRMGIKQLYDERVHEFKPALKKLAKGSPEWNAINAKQAAYKLAMNGGGYGKTGSSFSWQYDPLVMIRTTFMGQLALLMLVERFYLAGFEIVSANTDGVVVHYPKEKEDLVEQIKKDWENITKYELEDTYYSQIIFRNVNHYLAEIIDKDSEKPIYTKHKGDFEIDAEYHKNNSQRIVAIALSEYYLKGVPLEDVICNPGYEFRKGEKTTIYDYCIGRKSVDKVENYTLVTPEGNKEFYDKVIRFYISNSGNKFFKVYSSGKVEAVCKGFFVTPFMEYEEKEDYDINFHYYIRECTKIIDEVELGNRHQPKGEQLTLF
jgi:hypothetical protein